MRFKVLMLTIIFSIITIFGFVQDYRVSQIAAPKSSKQNLVVAKDFTQNIGNITYTVEKGVSYDNYLLVKSLIKECPNYYKYNCTEIILTTQKLYGIRGEEDNKYLNKPGYSNAVGRTYNSTIYIRDTKWAEDTFYHELAHVAEWGELKYTDNKFISDFSSTQKLIKKYKEKYLSTDDKHVKYFLGEVLAVKYDLNHEFFANACQEYFTDPENLKDNYTDIYEYVEDWLKEISENYNKINDTNL